MPRGRLDSVLRHLRTLLVTKNADHWTDADLVRRFADSRDEAAFAALVQRHGALVLKACRNVLTTEADADDAFQATFLILARKAASFRKEKSLASWLHGIAIRCARNLRKSAMRRVQREQAARGVGPPEPPILQAALHELQAILDEEIQRLPEKYRGPFLLCCLTGKSRAEAAAALGCKEGTLASRLATAREILQKRLSAGGVTLSAALAAAALLPTALPGAVPAALAQRTIDGAAAFAAGGTAADISAQAATIANGVLKSMLITKLNSLAILTLAASLTASVIGGLVAQSAGDDPMKQSAPPLPQTISAPVDHRGDPLPQDALLRLGSAQWRHGAAIYSSEMSADGKLLATSGSKSIYVWDLQTGKILHRFPHSGSIAFSPDGSHLACRTDSRTAYVWNLKSGKQVHDLRLQSLEKEGLFGDLCQFNDQGNQLVFNNPQLGGILSFDMDTKNIATKMRGKSAVVGLSPDVKHYLRFEETATLLLGDLRTGNETKLDAIVYTGHTIWEMGHLFPFSPDGKLFALVHDQNEVQIRQAPGGEVRYSFPIPDSAFPDAVIAPARLDYRLSFAPDSRTLLMGTGRGSIHRWNLATGGELPFLSKHATRVAGAHLLPDGRTLVSTSWDGIIHRWNLATNRPVVVPESYEGHQTTAAFSSDGEWAAIANTRGRIDLWDARGGKRVRTLSEGGMSTHLRSDGVSHLAFAPGDKLLAFAESSGTVRFWEIPSGKAGAVWPREPIDPRWFSCNGIQFSPDGRLLAIGESPRDSLRVVDIASNRVVWNGPRASATAFAPGGDTLAVLGADRMEIAFFDTRNWQKRATSSRIKGKNSQNIIPEPSVFSAAKAAFSHDGSNLAVFIDGFCLVICDGRTGVEKQRLIDREATSRKLDNGSTAFAFSADGRWLASGGSGDQIILWEIATGREIAHLPGHDRGVTALAFNPGGRTLASFGRDGQGYVWNVTPARTPAASHSLADLWKDLLQGDPAAAYRAQCDLIAKPKESTPFLRQRLIYPPLDAAKTRQWITDVDSSKFPVRDAASKALEDAGSQVIGPIQKALGGEVSLETRRRLEQIVKKLDAGPLALRTGRAIQVLELIGSPEARAVLEGLAAGAPGARETEEAQASLKRFRDERPCRPSEELASMLRPSGLRV